MSSWIERWWQRELDVLQRAQVIDTLERQRLVDERQHGELIGRIDTQSSILADIDAHVRWMEGDVARLLSVTERSLPVIVESLALACETLADIAELLARPRETEAQELFETGTHALASAVAMAAKGSAGLADDWFDEAIEDLSQATSVFRQAPEFWYNLGLAYASRGPSRDAADAFARCARYAVADDWLELAALSVLLATAELRGVGEQDAARDLLRNYLPPLDKCGEIYVSLAVHHGETSHLERALEIDPGQARRVAARIDELREESESAGKPATAKQAARRAAEKLAEAAEAAAAEACRREDGPVCRLRRLEAAIQTLIDSARDLDLDFSDEGFIPVSLPGFGVNALLLADARTHTTAAAARAIGASVRSALGTLQADAAALLQELEKVTSAGAEVLWLCCLEAVIQAMLDAAAGLGLEVSRSAFASAFVIQASLRRLNLASASDFSVDDLFRRQARASEIRGQAVSVVSSVRAWLGTLEADVQASLQRFNLASSFFEVEKKQNAWLIAQAQDQPVPYGLPTSLGNMIAHERAKLNDAEKQLRELEADSVELLRIHAAYSAVFDNGLLRPEVRTRIGALKRWKFRTLYGTNSRVTLTSGTPEEILVTAFLDGRYPRGHISGEQRWHSIASELQTVRGLTTQPIEKKKPLEEAVLEFIGSNGPHILTASWAFGTTIHDYERRRKDITDRINKSSRELDSLEESHRDFEQRESETKKTHEKAIQLTVQQAEEAIRSADAARESAMARYHMAQEAARHATDATADVLAALEQILSHGPASGPQSVADDGCDQIAQRMTFLCQDRQTRDAARRLMESPSALRSSLDHSQPAENLNLAELRTAMDLPQLKGSYRQEIQQVVRSVEFLGMKHAMAREAADRAADTLSGVLADLDPAIGAAIAPREQVHPSASAPTAQ